MKNKTKKLFTLLLLIIFSLSHLGVKAIAINENNISEKNLQTNESKKEKINSGSIVNTNSGITFTGSLLENSLKEEKIKNSKYYSGSFTHSGITFGNSLYDDTYNFKSEDLKGIETIKTDELNTSKTTTSFQIMSLSTPNTSVTDGLVGEWDLNGNANDTSGNGNNGIPYNVTWVNSSGSNQVASFNGSNSYIIIPNNQNNQFYSSDFSISLFVKYNTDITNVIIGKGPSQNIGGDYWSFIKYSDNKVGFRGAEIGLSQIEAKSNILSKNNWYNVTGVRNGNLFYIYIDGYFIGSQSGLNFSFDNFYDITLGNFSYLNSSTFFSGNLGLTKIYNKALTQSEIQTLYQEGQEKLLGISQLDDNTSTNIPISSTSQVFTDPTRKYSTNEPTALTYISNYKEKEEETTTGEADKASTGDPVNLATGEFDYTNTFMSIPGQGQPYEFSMSYKNQSYYNGPVGINWDHNYNKYLVEEDNGNILYYNGKLGTFRFIDNGSSYDYNLGLKANLNISGGLYELVYDDGRKEYFNANKKLSSQSDKYGNTINFTYSGGLLTQATDTLGRNIHYTYDNNRLIEVTDFNSNKVKLTYYDGTTNSGSLYDLKEITIDNSGNEASNSSNTKTISFEYTTGGNDITNHNIIKLIDSKGQTYVINTYDDDRVLTQTYGDGTITYDYTLTSSGTVSKNSVTNKVGDITDYFYDENGQNTSTIYHTDNGNITYEYTYDSDGYMTTLKKPNGNGTSYTYDSRGNILEKRQKEDIEASNSSSDIVTAFTYNSRNQILTKTLPNGVVITNTYDTDGNLLETTTSGLKDSNLNTYSTTKTFEYNELGQLTKSTDARGLETTFTYSGGLLIETISGSGTNARSTILTYNDYGILTSKTDPRGNTSNYEITKFNQTGTGVTAEGIIKSYVYDENNNITKEINYFTGGTVETNYTYDVLDNPTEIANDITSTKELITNIEYDANGNITSKTIGSGATIKYTYNEFSKVIEEKIIKDENDSGKDITTSYEYDDNGNLISKTDPLGNITAYTYDLYDRLKTTTKPDGTYTKIFYNDDDTISQIFEYDENDTLLTKTQYVYNGAGKVLKEITYKDPINNTGSIVTNTDYDLNGNIISKVDALGNETTFTYDEFNNLIQSEDELGNRVINTYDKNNNLTQKEILQNNSKSTKTIYVYDKDNRLVRSYKLEIISGNQVITGDTNYEYNNLNQIVKKTDGEGNITNYTYDYAGNVLSETKVTSNGNIITSYTYDERGNNTSITDGEGNITTYEYNNLNELVKTTYEDGKYITYAYDKAGNLVSQTDPNGNITTNTYDDLNRLVSRSIQTGTGVLGITTETYSYDDLGRLVEANDSTGHKLEFSYDSLNRLLQENQSGSIVNYTYDDNNNLLSITNPESNTTSYTYDELNRLTQVKQNTDTIAIYTYTGILNDVINYGNNVNITKGYDSLNRLNELNNGVKDYTYTYDDVSNITSDDYKDFTYDDIYRLTQVNESLSGTLLESFEFDDVGNRITDIESNTYTTNDLNQYTTLSGTTNINFSYDDNGNLIQNDEYIFSYDYKNRLVKVEELSGSGIIAEFSYDVLGRRYEKKTNLETTKYVYSNENVLVEYKTSNGITSKKEYINGLGTDDLIAVDQDESDLSLEERGELNFCNERVLSYTGGFIQYGWNDIVDRCESLALSGTILTNNRYYFSKNHLGSIDGITDNFGSLVASYEYDSYGNFTLSGSDIGNTRLFTGREFDFEIGLYYFRARYYDSKLGRFVSRDPIGQDGGINIYEYVSGNPISFVDLIGLEKTLIIGMTGFSMMWNEYGIVKKEDWDKTSIGHVFEQLRGSGNNITAGLYYGDRGSKEEIKNVIRKKRNEYKNIVLIGHSVGADIMSEISNELYEDKVDINLLITIDLVNTDGAVRGNFGTTSIKSNTKNVINYFQDNDKLLNFWGESIINEKGNNTTNTSNRYVDYVCSVDTCPNDGSYEGKKVNHKSIDDHLSDHVLHDDILNFLKK